MLRAEGHLNTKSKMDISELSGGDLTVFFILVRAELFLADCGDCCVLLYNNVVFSDRAVMYLLMV